MKKKIVAIMMAVCAIGTTACGNTVNNAADDENIPIAEEQQDASQQEKEAELSGKEERA